MFTVRDRFPYKRYRSIEGIAAYMKLAAVIARALSLSEIWPARIPPTMPPTSNRVERFPADFTDIYSPPISAVKKTWTIKSTKQGNVVKISDSCKNLF
jgi:hypothetical protein